MSAYVTLVCNGCDPDWVNDAERFERAVGPDGRPSPGELRNIAGEEGWAYEKPDCDYCRSCAQARTGEDSS